VPEELSDDLDGVVERPPGAAADVRDARAATGTPKLLPLASYRCSAVSLVTPYGEIGWGLRDSGVGRDLASP
jgi:hypothetical protein